MNVDGGFDISGLEWCAGYISAMMVGFKETTRVPKIFLGVKIEKNVKDAFLFIHSR